MRRLVFEAATTRFRPTRPRPSLRKHHSYYKTKETCIYVKGMRLLYSCDDFPFGKSAELKRRMFTRSGEPVAVRLAQDLYSIISVTEGEDHSILKGMISSGRKGKKTSVVSECRRRLRSRTQSTAASNQETCACSKELLLLKDTISTLQTNVSNMKQTMCVSDKLRCEQSAVTKSATFDLKQSVITCSSSIA